MNKAQADAVVKRLEAQKERYEGVLDGIYPEQKLTEKEKIEKYGSVENWCRAVLNALRFSSMFYWNGDRTLLDLQANFDLFNGRFAESFYNYVTDFYPDSNEPDHITGSSMSGKPTFPAKLRHYDIVSTRLRRLIGEEITRPLDISVVCTSPSIISKKLERRKQLIQEYTERLLVEELFKNPDLEGILNPQALNDVQGFPQSPEEVDQLSQYSFKERVEKYGADALKYLYEKQTLRNKFVKGFEYVLYAYTCPYYIGIHNNQPILRNVDPRWFDCDRTNGTVFIEDCSWAKETRIISTSQLYDEFGEYITEEKLTRIEQLKGTGFNSYTLGDFDGHAYPNLGYDSSYLSNTDIKVTHVEWKTLKKIGHLRYKEDGEWYETIVDEEYPTKGFRKESRIKNRDKVPVYVHEDGRELEWKWIQEVWQAVEVADEVIVYYGPKPNQHRSLDNPNECKLGYTGVFIPYPLMEQLKPLQVLYNIIMYRLELTIAKAKGNVAVIDIAQIPWSHDFDLAKVMYYMESMGVLFINSMEEGQGSQAGLQSRFNQWNSIDMSLANTIQNYIGILDNIRMMVAEITGISDQSVGDVSPYQATSAARQAITQSSFVTEGMFYCHKEAKKRAIKLLIEASQIAWPNGKVGQYIMDDGQLHLFDIDGDVYNLADYDVHLSDDYKYKEIDDFLKQHAAYALQSDQIGLSDMTKVLKAASLSDKEKILELAKKAREAMMREERMAQQQAQQSGDQMKLQIEQMKLEAQLQMNQNDNQTKITVAEIQAKSAAEDDIRNTREYIDSEMQLEREKLFHEKEISNKEIDLEKKRMEHEKETKDKELSIKEKEIEVKKKQLQNQNKNKNK